jgi:hypothetical protein
MKRFPRFLAALGFPAAALGACSDAENRQAGPLEPGPVAAAAIGAEVPEPLIAPLATSGLRIWPYTAAGFEPKPQDPMNLIFIGEADPRNVRSALLSASSARPAPFDSFDCAWTDAIGSPQTAFAEGEGWSGSVIQLECGAYDPFRFHLRLFPAGDVTLGNAHVEVLIPGTHMHEVLSWEFGEQFVTFDLARSGFLAAQPQRSAPLNESPTFGTVRVQVYNQLPPSLRALTGGPLFGDVSVPVGVPNDGTATVLTLKPVPPVAGSHQAFSLMFGQVIPKPFCAPEGELVRVDGPLHLRQEVRVSAAGVLHTQTFIDGDLSIRPLDRTTGTFGTPAPARVRDHYTAHFQNGLHSVATTRTQRLSVEGGPPQQLFEQGRVDSGGRVQFRSEEKCGR